VASRLVNMRDESTAAEMLTTVDVARMFALRTTRSTACSAGRFVCTRITTERDSCHSSSSGDETISTLSIVVGADIGGGEGAAVDGVNVGAAVGGAVVGVLVGTADGLVDGADVGAVGAAV
jgi:hypothetical protein